MKKSSENISEKENKKVNAGKQASDNEVREGQSNSSVYNEVNDKSAYPHNNKEDKQYKDQSEFIDRNSNTKDKS